MLNADPLLPNATLQPDPLLETTATDAAVPARINAAKLALLAKVQGEDAASTYKQEYVNLRYVDPDTQREMTDEQARERSRREYYRRVLEAPYPDALPFGSRANPTSTGPAAPDAWDTQLALVTKQLAEITASPAPADTRLAMEQADPAMQQEDLIDSYNQAKYEFVAQRMFEVGINITPNLDGTESIDYDSSVKKWSEVAAGFVPFRITALNGGWKLNEFLQASRKLTDAERTDPAKLEEFRQILRETSGYSADLTMQAMNDYFTGQTQTGTLSLEALDALWYLPAKGIRAGKAAAGGPTGGFDPTFNTSWDPGVFAGARRGSNAVAIFGSRGEKRLAGEVNAASMVDETVAAEAGTSREGARAAADPFNPFKQDPGQYTGIAPETVEAIETAKAKINQQFDDALGVVPDRGPLSVAEQAQFVRDKMQRIPRSVRVVEQDERGFKLELDDGTVTQRFAYTLDAVGGVDGVVDSTIVGAKMLSPSARLRGGAARNLELASATELESEAFGYELKKILDGVLDGTLFKQATSGISTDEWQAIDGLLIQGDRMSRSFTGKELVEGVRVEGVGIVKLSDRQIRKYYEIRHVYDRLWRVRDDIYVRDLEARGYRSVTTSVNGERVKLAVRQPDFMRVKEDGTVSVSIPSDLKRVVTIDKGKLVATNVNPKWASSMTGAFGRLDKPVKIGDEYFEYGFFKNDHIGDVGPGMLGYRTGYVPLFTRRVNYVVRQSLTKLYNGSPRKVKEVRSFFDTLDEANAFVAGKDDTYEVVLDKELRAAQTDDGENYRRLVEEAAFNGSYFHARSEAPIPYGTAQVETPRYGALDSLNRYTRAMAWAYPQTGFRQRVIEQFVKTFGDLLEDPRDWRSDLKPSAQISVAQRNAIVQYREDVKAWLSVRTEDESVLANLSNHISQLMEGKLSSGNRERIRNAGEADLIGYIKSFTHHATLGMLEAGQLVVQALGAATAVAVDPVHAAKAIRHMPFLRATAYMHPSHPLYEKAIKYAGGLAGISEKEALEMADTFRKAGLSRSLRNSNADWNAAENGLITSKNVLSRLADGGLILYRNGELFNRIASFAVAWERAKTARAGTVPKNSLLDDVMREFYHVSYNLQRANQANFQRGIFSLPVQFNNILFKYLEHMVPLILGRKGQWSRKEALSVLGIGTILFGMNGGLPFGQTLSKEMRNWVAGDPSQGGLGVEDANAAVAVEGGLTDLTLSWAFGVDVSVSQRAGLAGNVFQTWERWGGDATAAEMLLGASASSSQRVLQASEMAGRLMSPVVKGEEAMTGERFVLVMDELARSVRSWDNYHKARLWYNSKEITDRKGNVIAQLAEGDGQYGFLSNPTTAAKFLGFSTKELEWARELSDARRDTRKEIDESLDAMRQITQRIVGAGVLKESELQQYETFYNSIYLSLDEPDRETFANLWRRELNKDDKLSRDLRDLVDREVNRGGDPGTLESNPVYDNVSN